MRRTFSIAALVAVLTGGAFLFAPAATAQYPPPACTPLSGSQFAGEHVIGETFTVTLAPVCEFTPGSNLSVTVNGQSVTPPAKQANAAGAVTVGVNVESATSLLIDDPVRVRSQCGRNSMTATGPSQVARANVSQTATFDVLCGAAVPRARQGRTVAFTGANIARMGAIALALIGLGAVLVAANRRRAHAKG